MGPDGIGTEHRVAFLTARGVHRLAENLSHVTGASELFNEIDPGSNCGISRDSLNSEDFNIALLNAPKGEDSRENEPGRFCREKRYAFLCKEART